MRQIRMTIQIRSYGAGCALRCKKAELSFTSETTFEQFQELLQQRYHQRFAPDACQCFHWKTTIYLHDGNGTEMSEQTWPSALDAMSGTFTMGSGTQRCRLVSNFTNIGSSGYRALVLKAAHAAIGPMTYDRLLLINGLKITSDSSGRTAADYQNHQRIPLELRDITQRTRGITVAPFYPPKTVSSDLSDLPGDVPVTKSRRTLTKEEFQMVIERHRQRQRP